MRRLTVSLLALLLAGSVVAHANLTSSTPEDGAVLDAAPAEAILEFSEGLEAGFSTFKVYRLDESVDLDADNAHQRLHGLAAVLVGEVLLAQDDGESEARVDAGFEPAAGVTEQVTVKLIDDLGEGHYVVMWRALSIDTHVVQGHFVFSVRP